MNIIKPISGALKYAWALKIALKIAYKFYKYRKDGYSKEELTDIIGTFLNEIGIKFNQSKSGKAGTPVVS